MGTLHGPSPATAKSRSTRAVLRADAADAVDGHLRFKPAAPREGAALVVASDLVSRAPLRSSYGPEIDGGGETPLCVPYASLVDIIGGLSTAQRGERHRYGTGCKTGTLLPCFID